MNKICLDCQTKLTIEVLGSHGRFYIGYWCPNCGPYDRITDYFDTRDKAESILLSLIRA
jgi:hypothetical protein